MKLSGSLADAIVELGNKKSKSVIAICGAADLGKSFLARSLIDELELRGVSSAHLTMDSYLMPRERRIEAGISGYDAAAYDLATLNSDLQAFINFKAFGFQEYNHKLGCVNGPGKVISDTDYLLLDGLHAMHHSFKSLLDYSVFIYTSDKQLRDIRHQADLVKRNQTVDFSLAQLEFEFQSYKSNVEPYKACANKRIELLSKWNYVERD